MSEVPLYACRWLEPVFWKRLAVGAGNISGPTFCIRAKKLKIREANWQSYYLLFSYLSAPRAPATTALPLTSCLVSES